MIGGDGSRQGSYLLSQTGFPAVGIASTIDNDLYGSEITIGIDTALNIALESIDRLKVPASSHWRAFLVEVMGRDCGYLALMAGITGGAKVVVIPEVEIQAEQVTRELRSAHDIDSARTHAHCGITPKAKRHFPHHCEIKSKRPHIAGGTGVAKCFIGGV